MKDYRIGKKLKITFAVIIVIVLAISAVSIFGLTSALKQYKSFYMGPYRMTNSAADIQRGIESYAKNIGYSIMTESTDQTKEYLKAGNEALDNVNQDFEYISKNFRGDKSLVEAFNKVLTDTKGTREQVTALAANNQNKEASELYFKEVQPQLKKALEYLEKISAAAEENADKEYAKVTGTSLFIMIAVVIMVIVISAGTAGLGMYLSRCLTQPVKEIERAANRMAQGDFDVDITYESKDELGSLALSMKRMIKVTKDVLEDTARGLGEVARGNLNIAPKVEYIGIYSSMEDSMKHIIINLSDIMRKINDSAGLVSNGSGQMSESAQGLAEGALEQAGEIEELQATITGVAQQINDNAKESQAALEKTKQVEDSAAVSSREMGQMTQAMQEINDTSKQIGNIIAEIEEIASQTNLLSLNASIEAARAGEAGRGFAVVADQIGKLAADSAASAVNTRELIENSIKQVEKGSSLAVETAKAMEEVITGVREIAQRVEKTSAASVQQAEAIHQIQLGVEHMSGIIQNNSATAQETSATSEELLAQAVSLKELIGQFRLLEMPV